MLKSTFALAVAVTTIPGSPSRPKRRLARVPEGREGCSVGQGGQATGPPSSSTHGGRHETVGPLRFAHPTAPRSRHPKHVMAGLVPAIHVLFGVGVRMDALVSPRVEPEGQRPTGMT